MAGKSSPTDKALVQLSTEQLRQELARREALSLKSEYDRRRAMCAHIQANPDVFARLAELTGDAYTAKILRDPRDRTSLLSGGTKVVSFQIKDDPAFLEKVMDGSGKYIWDKVAPGL